MASRSTSAPTLPQISVLTATASVSIDHDPSLSPAQQRLADREAALLASSFSLQPPPRRRGRLRSHAACQTDASELGELVKNQDTLATVKAELEGVRLQMMHCEARLRHELRQEMETRVRSHDARNADKLAFLRKRSDTHVGQVRAASRTRLSALQATHRRAAAEARAAAAAVVVEGGGGGAAVAAAEPAPAPRAAPRTAADAAQTALLKAHEACVEENARLKAQVAALQTTGHHATVARLEAALAARDKTISVLREQLTAARRAGVAAASLFKGEKRVSITVAD